MKEHPILFSAPMVRAILAGRKSQTRRVIKPQPDPEGYFEMKINGSLLTIDYNGGEENPVIKCPYGQPDDRLLSLQTRSISAARLSGCFCCLLCLAAILANHPAGRILAGMVRTAAGTRRQ